MVFDGKTISLDPSIGNWSFPCQSHYWITSSEVRWVPKWRDAERNRRNFAADASRSGTSFFKRLFGKDDD
jgi:hypothetical protein